jgi:hypothetical protein
VGQVSHCVMFRGVWADDTASYDRLVCTESSCHR